MKSSTILFRCSLVGFALTTAFLIAAGCGSAKSGSGFDDGNAAGSDAGTSGESDGSSKGPGLTGGESDGAVDCNAGNYGSISGTAYAPNGTLPLYNVIVFAPTKPLDPLTEGVSCDKCGSVSGSPAASTTTAPDGTFSLNGVPAGDNVPIVLQVGKWRRQVTIPHITKCANTAITDPNVSRLPKNQTEGDLPHIAVTTGGCDAIACVLPKMGIDATEFGVQSDYADKRVIFYQGSGPTINNGSPAITPAENLWGSATEIAKYDVAIFSCECTESPSTKQPGDETVVANYLDSGGRTFGTDFMYTWTHKGNQFTGTPPTPTENIMQSFVGGAPFDSSSSDYTIDTTFPKGVALGQWMQAVGATTTLNSVPLTTVFKNFGRADPTLAQRWVYGDTDKAISYTTPFSSAEADRCGKSYFMDIHVGSGTVGAGFPSGCGTDLTPQEKMMVFFLMDLASCIQDDTKPVAPPR